MEAPSDSTKPVPGLDPGIKKGTRSWSPPGSRLALANKEPGYRYKWFSVAGDNDVGDRIEAAREEGWEPVSGVSGRRVRAGELSIDSLKRVGTLRLMKIPEEIAEKRDEYFARQTDLQTMRPSVRAAKMLNDAGGPYNPSEVITEPLKKADRYPTVSRRRSAVYSIAGN